MIRTYCDICGEHLRAFNRIAEYPSERLSTVLSQNGKELKVEVLTGLNGTANAGDFCKYCVLDALYKLDDRDKLVKP